MSLRFKGRFVKASDSEIAGGSQPDELNMGVHLLAASIVAAIIIIFFIIPEFSHKPTCRVRSEEIAPDARVLVPNRLIQLNTSVRRTNRITGDRITMKSQDAPQDEIVLARRENVQGEFTLMVQGDAVPVHAELLDTVGWLRESDAERKSEILGYLVVV